MKNRGPRNKLGREGLTYRDLKGQNGTGFVIRVLHDDVEPAQITTVVKQPGQEHLTVATVEVREYANPRRLYSGIPIQPESTDTIVSTLEAHIDRHPLAHVALQQLVASLPEEQ